MFLLVLLPSLEDTANGGWIGPVQDLEVISGQILVGLGE